MFLTGHEDISRLRGDILKGENSELAALGEMSTQVVALNQVYELYHLLGQPDQLTGHQVCLAVFGSAEVEDFVLKTWGEGSSPCPMVPDQDTK